MSDASQSSDAPTIEYLISLLAAADPEVRSKAAWSLGRASDNRAVEPLIDLALHDSSSDVRYMAMGALYLLDAPQSVELNLAMIADENEDELLRRDLMAHLTQSHDRRAFDLLAKLSKHSDPMMRGEAVSALSDLGDDRAFDLIIDALRDADAYVRYSAITALTIRGDLRALPALTSTVQNDSGICYDDGSSLSSAAARAIQQIQERDLPTPNP